MQRRYKFLCLIDNEIRSESGDCIWHIGEWQSVRDNELIICENGFHCSRTCYQAFTYVQGEILAQVEVSGASIVNDDKEAWQKMRLVRVWRWQKHDSVALSIFAAELVLENFEKMYPDDKRPRAAIDAARRWLAAPTEENAESARSAAMAARSAEWSAWSAWSAESAWAAEWSAAMAGEWSTARAARSAARAARSAARAARSAEWSEWSAWSAWSAARAAEWSAAMAGDEIIEKISRWMDERVAVLAEYEEK